MVGKKAQTKRVTALLLYEERLFSSGAPLISVQKEIEKEIEKEQHNTKNTREGVLKKWQVTGSNPGPKAYLSEKERVFTSLG